jgi:Protein of unknown function (DUF742)
MNPPTQPPWGRPAGEDEQFVRPYVLTSGRISPAHGRFDLITQVVAIGPLPQPDSGLGPEHMSILRLCQDVVMSVAEITGHLDLPGATVRVLLGDLLERGHVMVQEPTPEADITDLGIYEAVISGLRAL